MQNKVRKMSYKLKEIKFGFAEVRNCDLKNPLSDELKNRIIKDVLKHRLLIFKNQGILEPSRHLEIGKWFGNIESTFYDHPQSPHRDIFRVSNDPDHG